MSPVNSSSLRSVNLFRVRPLHNNFLVISRVKLKLRAEPFREFDTRDWFTRGSPEHHSSGLPEVILNYFRRSVSHVSQSLFRDTSQDPRNVRLTVAHRRQGMHEMTEHRRYPLMGYRWRQDREVIFIRLLADRQGIR